MTPPFFATAEDAEEAFYDAIARADVNAMMAVWSDDKDVICIQPTGQRLDGHTAIRGSWRAIFDNNPRFSVRAQDKACWDSTLISVHSVVEALYLQRGQTIHGPILATNVFVRGTNGWRLASRHASAAMAFRSVDEIARGSRKPTLH
jgi:ketosteroid isomerase-like protein